MLLADGLWECGEEDFVRDITPVSYTHLVWLGEVSAKEALEVLDLSGSIDGYWK